MWAILERWRINPHPSYRLGWSRCSCAACIFNGPDEFATLRRILPGKFAQLVAHEAAFGHTMKRQETLVEVADRGRPFPVKPADVAGGTLDNLVRTYHPAGRRLAVARWGICRGRWP